MILYYYIYFLLLFQKKFTKTRSRTLESMCSKAHFHCPNVNRGCTVRVPLDLMKWHKERCLFHQGECFMGKVWGDCNWNGCEIDWMEHCMTTHADKIFMTPSSTLTWKYEQNSKMVKPVNGYYIFKVFGETFNLYQISDKSKTKLIWTLICATREPNIDKKYAYQIEIFCKTNPARIMTQRHGCHAEQDQDILDQGRCISFPMSDVMLLLDNEKVFSYYYHFSLFFFYRVIAIIIFIKCS